MSELSESSGCGSGNDEGADKSDRPHHEGRARAQCERGSSACGERTDPDARAQAERAEQERVAKLTASQKQVEQLNAQLEQERQARLQAEQRATEAQAEAQAQRMVADELRNIRQVTVKEESRGLVLTLSGSVLFRSGSTDLLATARRRLNDVADATFDQYFSSGYVAAAHLKLKSWIRSPPKA